MINTDYEFLSGEGHYIDIARIILTKQYINKKDVELILGTKGNSTNNCCQRFIRQYNQNNKNKNVLKNSSKMPTKEFLKFYDYDIEQAIFKARLEYDGILSYDEYYN